MTEHDAGQASLYVDDGAFRWLGDPASISSMLQVTAIYVIRGEVLASRAAACDIEP